MRGGDPRGLRRLRRFAGVFALPCLLAGCALSLEDARSPALRAAPAAVAPRDYASACAPCHDRGGYAVRVLADRAGQAQSLLHIGTSLSPEAIRVIVRRGLGAMPAMSRLEVSDPELDGIVSYLGKSRPAAAP